MNRTLIVTGASVAILLLLIALNVQLRRTAAAELALTEGTHAAVAEVASDLETLVLSLDKLRLTTSPGRMTALLAQVILSCDRAQSGIADLPDPQGQREVILMYLSRVSRQAQRGLTALTEDGTLAAEERSALTELSDGARLLHAELEIACQALLTGEALSDALPATEVTAPPSAAELAEYRALPSTEVSGGEALQIAKEFIGEERVLSVQSAPDTAGALPAYGVTVQTADVQLNLEITRRGGKVLLMSPETASFPMVRSVADCTAAALDFLHDRGFAQMEALYHQVYDGLCVITCAYVQSNVLVWADRVLVQVRMDTAEVVGLEARSYWQHHMPRRVQTPLLTASEARAALVPGAEVTSFRLALLPQGTQERLCWQFSLTMQGEGYISYVDAITGEELLLEKVIRLDIGSTAA